MKALSVVFVIMVLSLGLISTPFSFAQTNENGTNITIELKESVAVTTENTDTSDSANQETKTPIENEIGTNLGQQVANFVHESRDLFEQQKEETKAIITLCRENLRNAELSERDSVREQCRADLEEIRESYHLLRETYHDAFKTFRESMKIFIQESKGLPVDDTTKDAALENIESLSENPEKREMIRELKQKMREEVREEKQKEREQLRHERELERDLLKAESEAIRKQIKSELEEVRESLKAEKENLREQIKKQQELEREQKQKERELERELKQKEREDQRDAIPAQGNASNNDLESSDEIENELEIKVEVEQGIAKIKVESDDEELEFEIEWTNEQGTIAEIASRTGLSVSEIEQVIQFEIEESDE